MFRETDVNNILCKDKKKVCKWTQLLLMTFTVKRHLVTATDVRTSKNIIVFILLYDAVCPRLQAIGRKEVKINELGISAMAKALQAIGIYQVKTPTKYKLSF